MTKEEKTKIYTLIKTVSDSLYGYSSPDFEGEIPVFEDDVAAVAAEENSVASQNLEKVFIPASETFDDSHSSSSASSHSTIENINSKIKECKRCQLCASRRQTVPGTGVEKPFVLVIGEGPGEEEDKQGLPFVGPAGQLLDKMLAAIQLYRNRNCYIANIVKCRPPLNRNPLPEEADACRPFLDAQIAALKPKAILCAGSVAVKNLLNTNDGVMKLHGQLIYYKGIPVVTTWHPSALLRNPENKRTAWEDLKAFKAELLKIDPSYDK